MKKYFVALTLGSMLCYFGMTAISRTAYSAQPGEVKFKEQCAVCHPDGGNIINPRKTLHKKDRETNNIISAADIIKTMRNPGPGMTKFDVKTISDKDAHTLAEYILKTFK